MTDPRPAPRSAFITSLAWSFIILAAFGVLIGLLQNIMFNVMLGTMDIEVVIKDASAAGVMPEFMAVIFRHMRALLAITLALSLLTLFAAIALLKRRNWARIVFVVMMWLSAAGNLGGLWLQYQILNSASMQEMMKSMNVVSGAATSMDGLIQGAMWFSALIAVVFAALFAWVAIRLSSREIKNEFGHESNSQPRR